MKTLIILFLFISVKCFGQDDQILGTWKFGLNEKIDYSVMMDSAKAFGYDTSTEEARMVLFSSVAAIVISRCENSEIFFSPFENQIMLITKRYNNYSVEDVQWGKWSKNNKNNKYIYILTFKNRIEHYQLNKLTNEFYLIVPENNVGIITKLLSNNLKLIKLDERK